MGKWLLMGASTVYPFLVDKNVVVANKAGTKSPIELFREVALLFKNLTTSSGKIS